jgi:hypothetical protein
VETTKNEIHINCSEDENPNFIKIVEEITNELIIKHDVTELSLVKIKNWFDSKWLNYSGKGLIAEWKEKITVPPFNPNRVLSEILFKLKDHNNKALGKPLHILQSSSNNLNNRIINKSSNAIYVWYSSNTEMNQKGCIMVYIVKNENIETWYASIENTNEWKVTKTTGIELKSLNQLLQ